MSDIIPNILGERKLDDWYIPVVQNNLVDIVVKDKGINSTEFKKYINEYAKSLDDNSLEIFKYAKNSARITKNKKDSSHFFRLFNQYFINSLNSTFPQKNFKELKENLEKLQKEFDKDIKECNIENESFIPALIGIVEGIIN